MGEESTANGPAAAALGERLRAAMGTTRFDPVIWVDDVTSTNAILLERLREGAGEQVMVAEFQSQGRGRRARVWTAPPGSSLMMSVLVRSLARPTRSSASLPASAAQDCVTALALAAVDACREVAGVEVAIKWPNDLVIDDRKLAGVLSESIVTDGELAGLVIGMGLNATWPEPLPDDLAASATSLNRHSAVTIDRVALAATILDRFAHWLESEPSDRLETYRTRSATIGREVRIELGPTGDGVLRGRAVDVDDEGALLVEVDNVIRRVSVGDVIHLRPQNGPVSDG